ncbi:MAG: glycoside hydrolase family 3 C-terminal domain-containing protein [Candidatus Andeanibacterium colombiense]|uniref:Glycoside hydrolase family 3 C-terminal domain-containing protein n=1 Tax=Candidatus Andeanibacterium colombiense TaxID=3121345 RepID=A0AAJ5X9S4_9SPHN|nr:MAG: glycoside hydrolase family 3 C-terminal domain-containing protein [Sphingomonadaceae bacterium]
MKFAAALLCGMSAAAAVPLAAQSQSLATKPWTNASLTPEKRADLILAQMSLDEKVAMLHGPMALPIVLAKMPEDAVGSAGYIPGNARLGIPALQESDAGLGVTNPMLVRGPDDMSTALPSSLALAATFDPQIAYDGGKIVGTEARAKTINVQLAGGVNLARDPRGGRNFEYAGEDPLLAGTLAGEAIRGIQSTGVISTVKHYALNGQEHNRMTADSVIDEEAARESDLLAFQIAIERGKPGSVMCSYNLVNGVYGCQNDWLLNQVLKKDWGYKGFVMSDWGAVHEVAAFSAGLDQQSGEQLDKQVWFDRPLKDGVAAGTIPAARVDDAARRVLTAMFSAGLFDRTDTKQPIDFDAHALVAQREAEDAIVLLENRGVLPIAAGAKTIAVIGGNADAGVASGTGSSQVTNPYRPAGVSLRSVALGGEGMMAMFSSVVFHPSSPLAALRERFKDAKVSFDNGAYPSSAAAAARDADVAVVFVYQPSGEGEDAPDTSLPFGQDALIEAVAAANPNTVVVLETGNAVDMPWSGKVGAVVQAWYGGQKGGEAIARVLTGEVNPSGRLPLTWQRDISQLPRPVVPGTGAAPDALVKVDYSIEGADVGYRWFARRKLSPLYWFGHGLSYTSFGYDKLAVSGGKTVTASVTVTNTGAKPGKDVVQLYLTGKPGSDERRLLDFEKVALAPGESRQVTLTADPRLLAEFDKAKKGWTIAPGSYTVAIGTDAGTMRLTGTAKLTPQTLKP